MSKNDFISLMVEETLGQETDLGESVLPFNPPDCFEVEAVYNANKKCFMICANNKFIEIPRNWGPFKNRISKEFIISGKDDDDKFLEVASTFFGRQIDYLKIQLVDSQSDISQENPRAA